MSRVQLAINVGDLESAVAFYSKLLRMEPSKRRPGYANFAVDSPPLKLVLIEGEGEPGSLNHLGIEVDSSCEVSGTASRFDALGLDTLVEDQVPCCYALQDKVWVTDPDGARWEVYTVLDESAVGTPGQQAAASTVQAGHPA
ncbi:MAG: VOC family protein [Actinomycetota bacterium]|nr:VOC family protein [Actinomycetota bacterium]